MKSIIIFFNLFFISRVYVYAMKCSLPDKCEFVRVSTIFNGLDYMGIICDIDNDEFELKLKDDSTSLTSQQDKCDNDEKLVKIKDIIFKWRNKLSIFEKRFNFTNAIRFFNYFEYLRSVQFCNINSGFDVNIFVESSSGIKIPSIEMIQLLNGRLGFYRNQQRINSCGDFIELNLTSVQSIFQIKSTEALSFDLVKVEYKQVICPLVFSNANISRLLLRNFVNTFYKTSFLKFSDEIFQNLNSEISAFIMRDMYNINLDLTLLHPSVFYNLNSIFIPSGSLNSIDGEIFKVFTNLGNVEIDYIIFRKINHKQGIKWIRKWNYDVDERVSKLPLGYRLHKELTLHTSVFKEKIAKERIFPDEDFCIYVDFPFNQMVIIYDDFVDLLFHIPDAYIDEKLTCTYLWLVKYYGYYYEYLLGLNTTRDIAVAQTIKRVWNSTEFKSMSKCDFQKRISLCNKLSYQIKDIWDENDYFLLNKKMETAFKILLYPTAFFGLITNLIVVIVILIKHNSDLFKEFKQYSYLYINSIFCMMISVIEILSWMTECFYPFEVFCPEIRKLVAIQFFKIIFKECLVTVFRFMCNFTYIAFALNRIGLIGKDHGKIVTFFSDLGIKKYIGVTLFISASFSWIKFFKYEVNYFHPYFNYPMSNEMDMTLSIWYKFYDFYFIFNSICDLFNYFVFVIICAIIDICMVVQLRRTLNEKSIKSALMSQKQNEAKKIESDKAVNKAIKMVVLNSLIGILFKIPVSVNPLLNMCLQFYYKSYDYRKKHPSFEEFYFFLFDSGFYSLIQDISYLLYTISLFIQFFIYIQYDKNFRTGFDRLKDKAFSCIKNIIKSP